MLESLLFKAGFLSFASTFLSVFVFLTFISSMTMVIFSCGCACACPCTHLPLMLLDTIMGASFTLSPIAVFHLFHKYFPAPVFVLSCFHTFEAMFVVMFTFVFDVLSFVFWFSSFALLLLLVSPC